jgi:DNA repair exonuclease SbcCD ATPase subunit
LSLFTTEEAEQQLNDFIDKVKVGGMSVKDYFNNPVNSGKTILKGYVREVDEASMSVEGFTRYGKELTSQFDKMNTKGGIASLIFKDIGSMALKALPTLIVTGIGVAIDYFVNKAERAKEKADELSEELNNSLSSYNDSLSQVSGYEKEFNKLAKGVDNFGNNLSLTNDEYDRYKDLSNDIAKINPSLIKGYDDEGNAIINKNNAIRDTINLLKEQRKLDTLKMLSEDNIEAISDGLEAKLSDTRKEMWTLSKSFDSLSSDLFDAVNNLDSYIYGFSDNGESYADYTKVRESLKQYDKSRYKFKTYYENQDEIYKLVQKLLSYKDTDKTSQEFEQYQKELSNSYDQLQKALNNTDNVNLYKQIDSEMQSYTKTYDTYLQAYLTTLDGYDELTSGEQNILSSLVSNFELDVESNTKDFDEQYADEVQKINSFYANLKNGVDNHGVPLSVSLDILTNLDTTQTVSEYKKQMETALKNIANSDFAKNQGLSIDDIKVMLGFSFETNDNEIEDELTNKIENIATRVVNRIPSLAGNQNGQAIIEGLLKNLTPDNIDTLMDTSLDKINSWQDVLDLLNTKTTFSLADYSEDVDNVQSKITALASAYKEIQDGTFEVGSSGWELVKGYEEFLPYLDDTNGGFEELGKKIKEAMGIAPNDLIKQLSQLKGLSDADQKSVNNLIKVLYKMKDVSLSNLTSDGLLTAEKNQVQAIIDKINDKKDKEQEYLDTLQEEEDTLNDIIDKYQTAGDTAIDYIEKEISSLEDSRDDVESYYDDLIDKLKEENDERDRAIELQEKQDALTNAKKKKVAIYSEASGWHLETNSDEVEKAQQELNSLQNEIAIDNLEKEKEAAMQPYTDQIEAFEKYKQAWSDAMSAYTNNQNEMIAQQILGIDWQGKLHNQDIGILNKYQTDYSGYQTKLKDNVQKEKEIIQNRIDQYAKEADEWEKYLKQFDTFVSDLSDQDVKYFEELKLKTLNEKSTYQERLDALREFKADYIQLSDDLAQYKGTSIKKALSGSGVYAVEKDNAILGAYTTKKEADKAMYKFAGQMISEKVSMLGGLSNISVTKLAELQKEIRSKFKVKQYATGGVNSYTGTAMLHGTPYKSEVIFNSSDAKKLYDIVHNTRNVASVVGKTIGDNLVSGTQAAGSMFTTNDTTNGDTTITFRIGEIHTTDGTTFLQQMNDYLKQADRDRMIGRNR